MVFKKKNNQVIFASTKFILSINDEKLDSKLQFLLQIIIHIIPDNLASRVSSRNYAGLLLASNEIFTRRSWNLEWSNELLCSHCYVHILPPCRIGSKNAAISVVEKIFDSTSIDPGLYNFIIIYCWPDLSSSVFYDLIVTYLFYILVLYCDRANINCSNQNCRMWLPVAKLSRNIHFYWSSIPHPFLRLLHQILLQKAIQDKVNR